MCVSIAGVEKTDVNLQMLPMVVNKVMVVFPQSTDNLEIQWNRLD